MLFTDTPYLILSILSPILLIIGLAVVVKKVFNSYYGIFFGLIFSGFAFGAFQAIPGTCYIIQDNSQYKKYRSFGAIEFKFANGDQVTILPVQGKTHVLNNSQTPLIIDQISYSAVGLYKNSSELKKIVDEIDFDDTNDNEGLNSFFIDSYAMKVLDLSYNKIDFFFDEAIPQTIEEYGSKTKQIKYWLHQER